MTNTQDVLNCLLEQIFDIFQLGGLDCLLICSSQKRRLCLNIIQLISNELVSGFGNPHVLTLSTAFTKKIVLVKLHLLCIQTLSLSESRQPQILINVMTWYSQKPNRNLRNEFDCLNV